MSFYWDCSNCIVSKAAQQSDFYLEFDIINSRNGCWTQRGVSVKAGGWKQNKKKQSVWDICISAIWDTDMLFQMSQVLLHRWDSAAF